MTYRFDVVTLFPELVQGYLEGSILGRAKAAGLIDVAYTSPRDFATDRHRTVDDAPFGGGAGMVMMPEPLAQAIEAVRTARAPARVVLLGPTGTPLTQERLERYASEGSLALVCGRYEGIDERIAGSMVDEEVSLGDYVLTGGELAAMAVIDGVSRLLPGVLGNALGPADESFAGEPLLEHPQYTRPRSWRGMDVPEVLLSGDHGAIARWRREQRLARTRERRPELLVGFEPGPETPGEKQKRLECPGRMDIYIALVHHPVRNRNGDEVATAVTNLDIHDLARAARSYGVRGYFLVTPLVQQRSLVERIVDHWLRGGGAVFNPVRAQAFDRVRTAASTDEAIAVVTAETGHRPLTVVTGAGFDEGEEGVVSYDALRERLHQGPGSALILFGTGWGLTDETIARCDLRLPAIQVRDGGDGYNHLSVRSAASIIIDRLLGAR